MNFTKTSDLNKNASKLFRKSIANTVNVLGTRSKKGLKYDMYQMIVKHMDE